MINFAIEFNIIINRKINIHEDFYFDHACSFMSFH